MFYETLSEEFIWQILKRKNGVVLYIKSHLKLELVLSDDCCRIVGAEVNLNGVKTMVVGLYSPNENKMVIYKRLKERKFNTYLMKAGV